MQPRLFVSAVFLSVPCGRGCNLQPPPGWELHASEFAMSPVSWLRPQRQSGARPGVCMSERDQVEQTVHSQRLSTFSPFIFIVSTTSLLSCLNL